MHSAPPASHALARFRTPLLAAGLGIWALSVGTGMFFLSAYAATPGSTATSTGFETPELRPSATGRCTLLMFAHPRCPCTAASVQELARIMAQCDGRAEAIVRFYRPAGEGDEWASGALYDAAAAIPGVSVEIDPEGELASRFGSNASGEVLLYDPQGHLCFRGGITPARGHEGDSIGKHAAISIIRGEAAQAVDAPTFGCGLRTNTAKSDD